LRNDKMLEIEDKIMECMKELTYDEMLETLFVCRLLVIKQDKDRLLE